MQDAVRASMRTSSNLYYFCCQPINVRKNFAVPSFSSAQYLTVVKELAPVESQIRNQSISLKLSAHGSKLACTRDGVRQPWGGMN